MRLAQLRGRIATLARGGHYESASQLLGELTRADLSLGLPADAVLRARQAAQLAEERGEAGAGPLVALAATLLAADDLEGALLGAQVAIERATADERQRIELAARLVGGAAQRRAGRLADARLLLDAARGAAARLGDGALAGLAMVELGWVDLAEQRAAAAATCFEFAAEYFQRAARLRPRDRARLVESAVQAAALSVASWADAGEVEAATIRAAGVADAARAIERPALVAFVDGALADLALARAPAAAAEACALAAESASSLPDGPAARDLRAQARLRQVRASDDELDRERHLEAGIEIAVTLAPARAGARLGAALLALVDDGTLHARPLIPRELERLAAALASLDDPDLTAIAHSVLADLGGR